MTVAAQRASHITSLCWLALRGRGSDVRPQSPVLRNPRQSRGFRRTGSPSFGRYLILFFAPWGAPAPQTPRVRPPSPPQGVWGGGSPPTRDIIQILFRGQRPGTKSLGTRWRGGFRPGLGRAASRDWPRIVRNRCALWDRAGYFGLGWPKFRHESGLKSKIPGRIPASARGTFSSAEFIGGPQIGGGVWGEARPF